MVERERRGVLLLNMGGPERLEEVRPFLFRLFRDPDILPLPRWLRGWFSWPLAWWISTVRAPKSRRVYAAIGGGSPLRANDEAVAQRLAELLADDGVVATAVAMRYWHPTTDAALDRLEAAGVERLVVVPMYPQYSTTTTMSSLRELHRRLRRRAARWRPRLEIVLDYHDAPGFVAYWRRELAAALDRLEAPPERTAILVSAHSIPLDRVEELGDPYPRQIEASTAAITAGLEPRLRVEIAYQSKVGPVAWLGPETPEAIERLAREGIEELLVVPLSFTSDHVETLEEIDQGYAALAARCGIRRFVRLPTPRTDPAFVEFLAELVRERLDQSGGTHRCLRKAATCHCLGGGG